MGPVLGPAYQMMGKAQQTPGLAGVFTTFCASSPQIYLEIDRTKAQMLNVPIANIFETLQVNLGSAYVNDFNAFGRIYQVRAQADQGFRIERDDITRLKVRSATGALVPLGTLVEHRRRHRPRPRPALQHVRLGAAAGRRRRPGRPSGEALATMEQLAGETLPPGMASNGPSSPPGAA